MLPRYTPHTTNQQTTNNTAPRTSPSLSRSVCLSACCVCGNPIDASAAQLPYGVREHRANISLMAVNGTITFELLSRHRNGSDHPCGPALPDIHCDLAQCVGEEVAGVVTYTCAQKNCWGCTVENFCSFLFYLIIAQLQPPFTLQFSNIDPQLYE
jgi:hypothetical protein